MPLPVIPFTVGTITGGAGVFVLSDATKNLATLGLVGIGIYYLYKKA